MQDKPAETVALPESMRRGHALLLRLRRNLLAIDVFAIGFLLFLTLWALLSIIAPGARLYAYEERFAGFEMPKAGLILQTVLFLAGYFVVQRIGIRYHHRHVLTGVPGNRLFAAAHLLHVLAPMLLLPLVFNMLGAFIAGVSGAPSPVTHADFDPSAHYDAAATWWDFELKRLDIALFGTYLPLTLRAWHWPWLTGLLLVCYLAYYLSPFVAVGEKLVRRQWVVVRRLAAVFVGTLLLTYIGYLLVPATGPRFEGTFDAWLVGDEAWFAARWWQIVLDNAEKIRWDAFPSGHTAIALVALGSAFRHSRPVAWIYLPFVVGLIIATVFLGYHYVTDVLAGVVFAGLGLLVIRPLVRWWDKPNSQAEPAVENAP